ncbi:MAG: hypothetical protein KGM24_04895, partial [Elusimicrobia bacterium]|nr:hypothetical protein [Elusimicrobiota bacterium]
KPVKADVSGTLFSRDPSSLRFGRVVVEASSGAAAGAAPARWTLDARTGRVLDAEPGSSAAPVLDDAELGRLARLARALDAWQGGAVEAAFSFDGGKLYVRRARALAPPPPPRPLSDPFSPRPRAEALDVRSVR